MRTGINVILQLILIMFSYLIPKNEHLIVFGSGMGRLYKGNPKSLFLYSLKDQHHKYQYTWISNNQEIYQKLKKDKKPILYIYSIKGFLTVLRAKYLIVDHGIKDVSYFSIIIGRFNIINTWHGTGFKNIGVLGQKTRLFIIFDRLTFNLFNLSSKKITKYKLILSTSEDDKTRKILSFNNQNVEILGSPRNDVFFHPELREQNFKTRLGLEGYNTVILYAPTFRDDAIQNPFSLEFLDILERKLIENNTLFIIKKHPWDTALKLTKEYTHIRDVSSQVGDVQELLIDVDMMISDYSGIVTDYVLLGKPVIFYTYDYDRYIESCRDFYYDLKHTLPGPFVEQESELLDYIFTQGWFLQEEYQKKYQSFVERFHHYKDGSSCERVFNYITQQLGKK